MDIIEKAIVYFTSHADNPIASQELMFWEHLKEQSLAKVLNETEIEQTVITKLEEYLKIIDILDS